MIERERYRGLVGFIDNLPIAAITIYGIVALINIYKKKPNYILEALIGETIMITLNGIFHIVTILPDAYGKQSACNNKEYMEYGWNILFNVTAEHCGDMIWSGHVSHVLFSLILISWCLVEHVGRKQRFKIIYWLISIVLIVTMSILIVMIEQHYSVDIILSLVSVPLIITHQLFHRIVKKCKSSIVSTRTIR